MPADWLTIALPKGRLLEPSLDLLGRLDLPVAGVAEKSRTLVHGFPEKALRYILCRPADVPAYVEHGAADLGVVGKDVIVEQGRDVFEMVDLRFGYCRFVVAVPAALGGQPLAAFNHRRVATKFPAIAEDFFLNQGLQVEIVKLHGNIEIAPLMGLAEMIVDLVSSGRTLQENNLVELATIMESTARLIVNRISFRVKHQHLQPLIARIRQSVAAGGKP